MDIIRTAGGEASQTKKTRRDLLKEWQEARRAKE